MFLASGSLGRIRVNGAAAAISTNLRVVQHVNGTVVIPHGPGFTPLTIFTQRRFAGSSLQLPLYTYHNNSNLGSRAGNIHSFRLKRGYMATMARNENGTGGSRVFIAQDDDLDITEMPAELGTSLRFVRVFPWRWVAKKGWAGGGDNPTKVDAKWSYNWNNNENSFFNREYVPVRQTRWWPDYSVTNEKQNVTQFLGFNEPDSADQANMSVTQAINEWPHLMRSGLRLGSPSPTDGGLNWLYQFMDEADALNYRVDFVAVHFYQANSVNQEMSYDSNSSWTTGIGQTLGAAQVIPLGQFKAHLAEAAANGFGGVVDFERGALHDGLTSGGSGFKALFDDGRKSLDFTNRPANGGSYSISGPRADRTAISGENSLSRSGNPNFDFEISNSRGFISEEKVVAAGLTALGRNGVTGSNFFRFTAWYTNGSQNGSTSVRRQINTNSGSGSADTFAGIAAPPGYWITRITLTSENNVFTSIDDLTFITSLAPEFLWAPDASVGGPGTWDNSAVSWTTGDRNLAWLTGNVAKLTSPGGAVEVAAPIAGVKGMVVESTGYTLDPTTPDGFPGTFSAGTLSFTKRTEAVANNDISYAIETSSTLAAESWIPVTPDVNNATTISFTLPADEGGKLFARLKVVLLIP